MQRFPRWPPHRPAQNIRQSNCIRKVAKLDASQKSFNSSRLWRSPDGGKRGKLCRLNHGVRGALRVEGAELTHARHMIRRRMVPWINELMHSLSRDGARIDTQQKDIAPSRTGRDDHPFAGAEPHFAWREVGDHNH